MNSINNQYDEFLRVIVEMREKELTYNIIDFLTDKKFFIE